MSEGPKNWAPKNNAEEQELDPAALEKTTSAEQEPRPPKAGDSLIIWGMKDGRRLAEAVTLTKDLEIGGTLTYEGVGAGREKIGEISEIKSVDYELVGSPQPDLRINVVAWDITLKPFMGPTVTYRLIPDTEQNRFYSLG